MNLLVDGCTFERASQRGVQRYYYELLSRVPPDSSVEIFFRKLPQAPVPPLVRSTELTEEFFLAKKDIKGRIASKVRRLWFPTPYPTGNVFHSTYFTRCPHQGVPEVLTVHDMVPEIMPEHFPADVSREITMKKECILAAERIIAISHATASDLVAVYPEISHRVEVIHSGGQHFPVVDEVEVAARVYDDEPYVVFVGERRSYKNFVSLLEAMTCTEWPREVKLVAIGAPFTEDERLTIQHRGLKGRVQLVIHPTDAMMRSILVKARAFVFPSLMEGFGFPLVEAQALGVPVVASDTAIFREIGGDAFVPVVPLEPSSIAAGVTKALAPEMRHRLVSSGRGNLTRFSWEDCAWRTWEVWKSVANLNARI